MTFIQKATVEKIIKPSDIYNYVSKECIKKLLDLWRIEEFRVPNPGDTYIAYSGDFTLVASTSNETNNNPRFIVSRRIKLPSNFPEWE